ncbi:MAG: glutathione S-transferase family protein [Xanthomonadales bacterium]|nr:glutathione S-transferase family protein [Xanthomonadales bacterium]
MKLYWCPNTRATRALWMLEETGLDYDLELIDIRNPEAPRDPDFSRASPMGKVPALSDGDVHMADSAAIGIYLADRYPESGLAPALDVAARGPYLWWMLFTPAVVEPCMAEKVAQATPNPVSHGWGDFDSMLATLEQGLAGGPWILGDRFSAADVMVGSTAYFLKVFGMLPEMPVVEAYVQRCLDRPAYQRALAINDEAAG